MKFLIAAFSLISFSFGAVNITQAALIDRGGGMIYDTDLNITWLADANYALTSGYSSPYGYLNWSDAMTWASNLTYGGYSDWRLPSSDHASCDSNGLYHCTGSEMGHLFYVELGNTTGTSILNSTDPDLALFTNFAPGLAYWSSTDASPTNAYYFYFTFGVEPSSAKEATFFAWPVRSGDVAAVPVPAAVWLFGSGLLGLAGVARRRRG